MWIWLVIGSALFLGLYDVCKKQSLRKNSVMAVLFFSTALSTVLIAPFFSAGPFQYHIRLLFKALLVACSWISGLAAMELVPLSTVSTLKTSRPVFVLLLSILLFGERLNALQWSGSILAIAAIILLGRTSRREGIVFTRNRGILYMFISILSGVASALYDKHIMGFMEPLFVQCWTNLYISIIMGAVLLVRRMRRKSGETGFKWDWYLPLIAICITAADFLYFKSLSAEGSMLSVVSMVRRSSVIVPFVFGAVAWKEKNIALKGLDLLVMLAGMVLLTLGSI